MLGIDRGGLRDAPGPRHDPNATTAGELAQGSTYHVDAGATIEEMRELVAEDVGVSGGATSAEEAAVHIIEEIPNHAITLSEN